MKKSRVAFSAALLLAGSLAISACAGGPSAAPSAEQTVSGTIHIGAFGGDLGKAILSVVPAFEKEYGVTVTSEDTNATQLLTSLVATRNQAAGAFDLVMLSPTTHLQGVEAGIFQELNPDLAPVMADLPESVLQPGGKYTGLGFFRVGLAYNENALKAAGVEPPTSWDDLWNPQYAGHIVLPGISAANLQLVFDYVWHKEGSVDKAKARFEQLVPNVKAFLTTQPEFENALSSGDAWITILSDTRANLLAAGGAPIKWVAPKPGAADWTMYVDMPKNAPNKPAALAFINFLLEAPQQEVISKAGFFSPVNPNATIDPSLDGLVGTVEGRDQLLQPDWSVLNEMSPDLQKWWTELTAK